ncbi:MAG: glycosyltransferase family 39 protein [Bryobacteraceae bacterium]
MSRASRFWTAMVVLIGVLAFVQVRSIRLETQTFDEGFDLAAGYSYWKTGDFRINREHPPLGKLINALPLLVLNPSLPLDHPSWAQEDNVVFGEQFLYFNRVPADTLLFAGRMMSILTTLIAAFCFALWMRRRFGDTAALIGLTFLCFDPNLIAHGRYVTSDIFVAVFFFFASVTWVRYLEAPSWKMLILAGALTGCALTSKVSALYLLPVFFVLYLLRPGRFSFWHMVGSMAGLVGTAVLVVIAVYAPEVDRLAPATHRYLRGHRQTRMIHEVIERKSPLSEVLVFAGRKLKVQNHSFLVACNMVAVHNATGHPAYVLGKVTQHGAWYYFPVAFAVKTPTAVLLALLGLLAVGVRRRRPPILWIALVMIPAGYFAFSMAGNINIGLRHILPVYLFLYAMLGAVMASWRKWVVGALLVLLMAESLAIHPHYLAFFNWVSGGPGNGPRYLVDSNIDWGQDVVKLRDWMAEQKIPRVYLHYFGRTDLTTYGLPFDWLPRSADGKEWDDVDGYAAVSVTPLMGVYTPWEELRRVRERPLVAKVGYSIYVFDMRKARGSTERTK